MHTSFLERGTAAIQSVGTKHQLKQCGIVDREGEISAGAIPASSVWTLKGVFDAPGKSSKTVGGQIGKQSRQVSKVVGWRGM